MAVDEKNVLDETQNEQATNEKATETENKKLSKEEKKQLAEMKKEEKARLKAEKKAAKKEAKSESGKKGGIGKIIVLFLLLLIIAGLAFSIVSNPFGIREKYLRPALENVPIVRNVLPAVENTQDTTLNLSKEELLSRIVVLESTLEEKQKDIEALNITLNSQNAEIARLKIIEENQLIVKQQKDEFDAMIAENDPNAYIAFYESIDPANRGPLYDRVALNIEQEKVVKDYINTFANMDASAVALILEQLIGTDMELVVAITERLDAEQSGLVLAAMQPSNAASVAKMMAPNGFVR